MSLNDGITIFCTKGNLIFSSSGEIIVEDKKSRKHVKNKSVIYPFFEDMKEYNENSYWTDQLTKFSRGIFPRNLKFYNGILYYKNKKKKTRDTEFEVDLDDLEKSFLCLKKFLEDKGILSTVERGEKAIIDYKQDEKWDEWKDFKQNQSFIIDDFIDKTSEEYELDKKGRIKLESVIRFGIACGVFNNENILIEDGDIVSIEGLEWDDEEEKFYIDENIQLPKFQAPSRKISEGKSGRYSSHTFSGDTFCIKNNVDKSIKVSNRWKNFLSECL